MNRTLQVASPLAQLPAISHSERQAEGPEDRVSRTGPSSTVPSATGAELSELGAVGTRGQVPLIYLGLRFLNSNGKYQDSHRGLALLPGRCDERPPSLTLPGPLDLNPALWLQLTLPLEHSRPAQQHVHTQSESHPTGIGEPAQAAPSLDTGSTILFHSLEDVPPALLVHRALSPAHRLAGAADKHEGEAGKPRSNSVRRLVLQGCYPSRPEEPGEAGPRALAWGVVTWVELQQRPRPPQEGSYAAENANPPLSSLRGLSNGDMGPRDPQGTRISRCAGEERLCGQQPRRRHRERRACACGAQRSPKPSRGLAAGPPSTSQGPCRKEPEWWKPPGAPAPGLGAHSVMAQSRELGEGTSVAHQL
ncbi:Protein Kibra [Manis pentadactyla]|nr:Protein Kibra [Manis pentadactyla]